MLYTRPAVCIEKSVTRTRLVVMHTAG